MKRLLLIVLPLLLIVGCSHTRYVPFITFENLELLRYGDDYNKIYKKMGIPILKLQLDKNKTILEYNYRFHNRYFDKILLPFNHNFNEKPNFVLYDGIYSGNTDYSIRLTLINDELVKVKIGDEIFIKE
jgi:hypothetical protein